jgi:hypothetical protein
MYNANKSLSVKFVSVFLSLFFLTIFTSPVAADENYGNVPPDANMMMSMSSMESVALPFDPNYYNFLVYVPYPGGQEDSIRDAMKKILGRALTPSEIRTWNNPVTTNDLATHDILIVGWNSSGGNTNGLHSDDLLAGITGRVILTGHDLDYHTVKGIEAAQTMLTQAIDYVLAGGGTGMITLGCTNAFPYLPKQTWGISAQTVASGGEFVGIFTPEGQASGLYNGLEPGNMCGWGYSYHDKFTITLGSAFVPFELGGNDVNDIITIARDDLASLPPLSISKTDNAPSGGVKPSDRFTYTIYYKYTANNPNYTQPLTNVVLTDYLPAEVNHTNVVADHNGAYDSNTHKVTWTLGALNLGDSNSVTVAVTVGNTRPSTGYITNTVKIRANDVNEISAFRFTPWCKVHNATKNLWYRSIQSAITDNNTTNNDVLVAYPGIYTENIYFDNNKLLTLQSLDANDPLIIAQTIISCINHPSYYYNTVTFTNNNSTVNGFTIANSNYDGVYCSGGGPTIKNCYIRNNGSGLNCNSLSAPTIANCIIKNNSSMGIYCYNAGQVKIINNWIVNNYSFGIAIVSTNNQLTIRNNTISRNTDYGIYRYEGNKDPNISNCIIWNNGANLDGTFDVNYCCINGTSVYPGNGNIKSDPCFVDINAGNYHIKAASLCRNAGDPNRTYDINETDIDGQPRRNGTARAVDIGGDEYYGSTNLNGDGLGQINFYDYAIFANAWRTYPGDTKWNTACDFIDDNDVNCLDLAWFAQDWYFPPADQQSQMEGMSEEQQSEPQASATGIPEEQQMMIEESELPPIYLFCDTNMPEPNQEVTVYFHSDTSLLAMGVIAVITGDATITTAMCEADCNQYGWDNGWNSDPYIDDVDNWVYLGSVSWESQAAGTVGYFKFIYHGGQVTVSIYDEWSDGFSDAFTYDSESDSYPSVPFSADVLIFGSDPNE